MGEVKWTPGPWRWQGEDYRGGWGWQLLVGADGEGIACGQDPAGGPYRHLQAHCPILPEFCKTGMMRDEDSAPSIHVREPEARLIAAAPDLYEALKNLVDVYDGMQNGDGEPCPDVEYGKRILARARGDAA